MEQEIKELKEKLSELDKKNAELKNEVSVLERENRSIYEDNDSLREKIIDLKKENDSLEFNLEREIKNVERLEPKTLEEEMKKTICDRFFKQLPLSRLEELENFEKLINKNYLF